MREGEGGEGRVCQGCRVRGEDKGLSGGGVVEVIEVKAKATGSNKAMAAKSKL